MIDFASIPVVTYVFLGVFVVVSGIHLYFCFVENELARKITKPMTTGALLVAAMVMNIQAVTIYLALFCGFLGDVFLLKKHKVLPFVLGMLAFMGNHILNIASVCILVKPEWPYYVGGALFLILFSFIGYHFVSKFVHQKKLAFGGTVYLGLIVLSFLAAVVACARGYSNYMLLAAFGGVSFIVSDLFLAKSSFIRNFKRRDFFIMSTYLLAQLLIVSGFLLTWMIR